MRSSTLATSVSYFTTASLSSIETTACLTAHVRESPELKASLKDLVASVRAQGLEGLIAKRRDSRYEPGQRSGTWRKMRINKGQEFVIAGYTVGGATFDALVFGYYEGSKLLYVSRTRNGFTPRVREELMKRFRGLEITECPFANLPEPKGGRWGGSRRQRWRNAGGSSRCWWGSLSSPNGRPAPAVRR